MNRTLILNKYRGFIFDFDGTLVDSMALWHEIDQKYLAKHGLTCPDGLSMDVAGMSFTETAHYFKDRFKLPDAIDTIKNEWQEMSHQLYLNDVVFKPGALAFLKKLYKSKKHLAIATSNIRRTTEAYLTKHDALHYFDSLVFSCEVGAGKPDPAVFLTAAKEMAIPPDECIVFEDTYEGVLGANNAHMDVIAVEDQWQGEHLLNIKELSCGFIRSFHEVEV